MTVNKKKITILGSSGWIGKSLLNFLKDKNLNIISINRKNINNWLTEEIEDEEVIYTIGLTADFRKKPYETVDAHITLLSKVLRKKGIKSLIYFSSTRVYNNCPETNEESPLNVSSLNPSDLYNISKLMGESLVLNDERRDLRVIRLSNVIGPFQPIDSFLGMLLADIRKNNKTFIKQSPQVSKDYIHIDDVNRLLYGLITNKPKHRIYNIGYGQNISNSEIASWLRKKGAQVYFKKNQDLNLNFKNLDVKRIYSEYDYSRNPFENRFIS